MLKFPLIPLGNMAVVTILTADLSVGGIAMPGQVAQEDYVVGTVISVGSGNVSPMGQLIPNEVAAGDDVCFQKVVAHKISYSVRRHIIMRTPEELRAEAEKSLDNMAVVMCDNIVAKFEKAQPASEPNIFNPLDHEQSK